MAWLIPSNVKYFYLVFLYPFPNDLAIIYTEDEVPYNTK